VSTAVLEYMAGEIHLQDKILMSYINGGSRPNENFEKIVHYRVINENMIHFRWTHSYTSKIVNCSSLIYAKS